MADRLVLPPRRETETFDLRHGSQRAVFQVSVSYWQGFPVEVFISGAKAGSETESIARDGAILLSLAMQYGIPLDAIRRSLTREQDGSPSTIVGAVIDKLMEGTRMTE